MIAGRRRARLVRSEDGHHVLTLPGRMHVVAGDLAEEDCRAFAAAVRAETPVPGDRGAMREVGCTIRENMLSEPAKLHGVFDRAKADPYRRVRATAPEVEPELQSRYLNNVTNATMPSR